MTKPTTTALTNFLANWSSATVARMADLYIFTLITGEAFYYSSFQTPIVAPFPTGGYNITNSSEVVGTNTLHFASPFPAWMSNGLIVTDTTTPGAIPPGTTVVAYGGPTVAGGTSAAALSNTFTAPVGSGDIIQFQGNYVLGPRFKRGNIRCQIGPQVDELSIEVFARETDLLAMSAGGTISWQRAFHEGIFDGAMCQVLRAYLSYSGPSYLAPTVQGTITVFQGRVGDIEIGRTSSKMIVKSLLDLLTVQMPRRLLQASCNHIFGEPGVGMCGYDRTNGLNALGTATGIGAVTITCLSGSDQGHILTSFAPSIAGSYDNGTIVGHTGLNTGFQRTIGQLSSGGIYFLKPFIFPVVAGTDQFTLLPGCDHTLNTCTNTFQNQLRYGGFPYIPPPESAV